MKSHWSVGAVKGVSLLFWTLVASHPVCGAVESLGGSRATVKSDSVAVYAQMSKTSAVIRSLKKGQTVRVGLEVSGREGAWCGIRDLGATGRIGYVLCKHLEREQLLQRQQPLERQQLPEIISGGAVKQESYGRGPVMGSGEVLTPFDLVRNVMDSLVRLFPTKFMLEKLWMEVLRPKEDMDLFMRQVRQKWRLERQSGILQCRRRFLNFMRANKGIGGSLSFVAAMPGAGVVDISNRPQGEGEKFFRDLARMGEEMENVEVQREAASIDECFRARTHAFWAEFSPLLTPEQKIEVAQEKEKNPALRSIIP